MNKTQFNELVKQEFHATDEILVQIEIYKTFLQQENQKYNLTRLDKEQDIYGLYFYDSLLPYKDVDFSKIHTVLDVGSGSGIPGILLKIFFKHIKLTIVESSFKKTNFLKLLCEKLQLEDVQILTKRAEELGHEYRDYFDLSTARAVADLKIILELLIPYTNKNGICIVPKGKRVSEELHEAKNIIRKLKIELFDTQKYLSSQNYEQYALFFIKKQDTPTIYPRKWSSIIHDNDKSKEQI